MGVDVVAVVDATGTEATAAAGGGGGGSGGEEATVNIDERQH